MLNHIHTKFFNDLKSAKHQYLKNSENDSVKWTVDADGIAGETSGGAIKQDVTIQIFANGQRILESELNFSLKSDSVSIHGGGIYNSMPEIFDMFKKLMPSRIDEGKKYLKSITTKKGHEETSKDAINAIWKLVGEGVPKSVDTKLSNHFWGILEKRLFGASGSYQGKMQLLEMNKKELREITKKQFTKLRESGVKLYPKWVPNDNKEQATPGSIFILPFYPGNGGKVKKKEEKNTNMSMFKIRVSYVWIKQGGARLRPGDPSPSLTAKSEPAKVFIELGGKESIVHDENWDKFVKKGLVKG